MKKGLLVAIALLLVFALVACSAAPEASSAAPAGESAASDANGTDAAAKGDDGLVIGVTMQGNQSGFVQYLTSGIYEYQKANAPDVKLDVVFADDDAAKQHSQMEQFISNGVDAIIMNPVDKVQGAAAVDLAADAGIPVITLNTTTDSTKNAAHVGSDDVDAGRMQMQHVIDVLGPDAKIAYVNAVLGHSAQVGRLQGYEEVFAANPDVEVVADGVGNWSADESMKLAENWLQSGMEIDAIVCMADCQLQGVITAVDNANMTGKILLTGMDCDQVVRAAIKDGKVESSVWQDGLGQGENALKLAISAAKGEEVSDFIIPYELCTQENIDEYNKEADARDELAKQYF